MLINNRSQTPVHYRFTYWLWTWVGKILPIHPLARLPNLVKRQQIIGTWIPSCLFIISNSAPVYIRAVLSCALFHLFLTGMYPTASSVEETRALHAESLPSPCWLVSEPELMLPSPVGLSSNAPPPVLLLSVHRPTRLTNTRVFPHTETREVHWWSKGSSLPSSLSGSSTTDH